MSSSAISLFAGAGGMDIGVHAAGFNTVCAIESDPHCAATLRRNGHRKVVWQADVRVIDPERLLDVLGFKAGELGLLHGGPPCQPFSQIGKLEGLDDPRGALIFDVLRFVRAMRPASVLIEQVPTSCVRKRPAAGAWRRSCATSSTRSATTCIWTCWTHAVATKMREALCL